MFERCMYFNTNALARKLNARWEAAFETLDLPPSHAYLLRLVLEEPGMSQQTIAKRLRLEKSTVARFIHKLEAKALVKRVASTIDSRENGITPTARARALQKELEALGDQLYQSMCEAIGEDEVRRFVAHAREFTNKL